MKYIILCGGAHPPVNEYKCRHFIKIAGEALIERTIRLLREAGVQDIIISTSEEHVPDFECFGLPIVTTPIDRYWVSAFPQIADSVCYILGDVYFSPEAIKTIVDEDVEDIQFFASAPPFSDLYPKKWAEPFAFKVVDTVAFQNAVETTKRLQDEGRFRRVPIAWELWQVIRGTALNHIFYDNYKVINDYTSDIDWDGDNLRLERKLRKVETDKTVKYMIHAVPERMWYVDQYLIPSMKAQGCENISVCIDQKKEGSLKTYLDSFLDLPDTNGGTWHIQDDVIISSNFYTVTSKHDRGIVCGFASQMYDKNNVNMVGDVAVQNKWFSFPCIRIPDRIAKDCAKWVKSDIIGNPVYRDYWKVGRNEDWAFWMYVRQYGTGIRIVNLAPNIVDHIDWLIGGSASASKRKEICRAYHWAEEELVEALKIDLQPLHSNT